MSLNLSMENRAIHHSEETPFPFSHPWDVAYTRTNHSSTSRTAAGAEHAKTT